MSSNDKSLIFNLESVLVEIEKEEKKFPIGNVYCVGRNYEKHAIEMGNDTKEEPFFFSKFPQSVTNKTEIFIPEDTNNFQYEVELVVFIGRNCSDIEPNQAKEYIFGYSVGIDLTKRDLQKIAKDKSRPWTLSKGFEYSAPISKIKRNENFSINNGEISLIKNGVISQKGNICEMTWSVDEIISKLSKNFKLFPGDLIFTGTPSGVGRIEQGDRIEAIIENVGILELTFL